MSDTVPSLIQQVEEDCLRSHLYHLAKDPLPYRKVNHTVSGHRQHTLAETDAWIGAHLHSYGYAVEREACPVQAFGFDANKPKQHSYADPPPGTPVHTAYNLYARKRGRSAPEEIILLLAHKDSQSWIDSPGAYDNGSGTVAILEIARVLGSYPSERSLWFLFCNEEHEPWTSVTAAQNAKARGDNLVAIFNVDSVGGKSDQEIAAGLKPNVTLYTTPEGKRLTDLMAAVNEAYGIGLAQRAHLREFPNDDDGSFVKAGFGCAVANIGSFPYEDAQYHLEGDIPERVDFENVRMAAQATLAAVVWLDQGRW